jgi:LmbE family N-acetylglucosaminyl deacetylase
MQAEGVPLSRKEFLLALAAPVLAPEALPARDGAGKLLIVVAHPDDEYAFSATVYRMVRELGWSADQVVITDGEAGYRYSALAETFYGKALANERDGRVHLPTIRREETIRAGKILGIGHHYFLDQRDLGFARDAAAADAANWDRPHVLDFVSTLMARERYDAVLTLLPTAQTHGHHRAAAQLASEAIRRMPQNARPLLLGAEPRARNAPPLQFRGGGPAVVFDRAAAFGYHDALNYQIVVNWVIAEHKSQGLFQMDCGRHDLEEFWVLENGGQADPVNLLSRFSDRTNRN